MSLTYACGAQKQERAYGLVGVFEPYAVALYGLDYFVDS